MSLLIKNGRVVTAADDYHADIFIENDTVSVIGKNLVIDADQVVNATGKLVIPGVGRSPYPSRNAVRRNHHVGRL